MITSAANAGWPGDISLEERYAECGLSIPSVIRTSKIATNEPGGAQPLGRLPDDLLTQVRTQVHAHLSGG